MPDAAQAPSPALARPRPPALSGVRSWTIRPDGAVLALLAVWSVVPLAILFGHVGGGLGIGSNGRVFTGADGPDIADQLQYMAWIRDAGEHVLFSNQYDLKPDPHLFLNPMFLLSGLAWKLGASLQLSFLAWKPVVVLALFAGFAAYVRRLVGPGWSRPAALVLALFFFTPAAWLLDWAGVGSQGLQSGAFVLAVEMFPGSFVWGLWPLALSVALMPVFLLCLERALDPARRGGRPAGWYAAAASAAGLASAWLHPWQGLTLLVITAGLVVWGRLWRRAVLLLPVAATAAPLAYYYALTRTDSAWATVSQPSGNPHVDGWLFAALAPPLLLAAAGFPGRRLDLQERAVRLWPLAALIVYFVLQRSWFYHALAGLSLPLAILGVRGWRRLRAPIPLGVALIVALTLPGMAYYIQKLRETASAHFLARGEAAALRAAGRSPRPGGILTTDALGAAVPAFSGRSTWVGHFTWTPDHAIRGARAQALFAGALAPADARALVHSTGAAFALAPFGAPDLRQSLGPTVAATRRFGCATLYDLAP